MNRIIYILRNFPGRYMLYQQRILGDRNLEYKYFYYFINAAVELFFIIRTYQSFRFGFSLYNTALNLCALFVLVLIKIVGRFYWKSKDR